MVEGIILCGWRDIASACGVKILKTIRKRAKKYNMPICYMDRRPTVTRKAIERWWEELEKNSQV